MNKSNVWIIVGVIGLVFAAGFIAARISTRPEATAVQSQDREAARLEAEAEIAAEKAEQSAKQAEIALKKSRAMWEKFNRLSVLCSYDRLYDVEMHEIKNLYEQIQPYFEGSMDLKYNNSTGKVDGVFDGQTSVITPDAKKAYERDKKRVLELHQKAVDDARIAAEKRMECLKYAASKH